MATPSSTGTPAAYFGNRFAAFMIDAGLLFALQWVGFMVLSRQLQAAGMTSTEPCVENGVALCQGPSTLLWAILVVFLVGTTIGYHAVFEGRFGATPGKRWMGIVVVDEADRTPPGHVAALTRSVVRQAFWLSLLFVLDVSPFGLGLPPVLVLALPLLTLIDFVVGAVRVDGIALHDRAARTRVIAAHAARSRPRRSSETDPPAADPPAGAASEPTDPSDPHDFEPSPVVVASAKNAGSTETEDLP